MIRICLAGADRRAHDIPVTTGIIAVGGIKKPDIGRPERAVIG